MGSCAAPSAKGDDKFITTDYLQQCPPEQYGAKGDTVQDDSDALEDAINKAVATSLMSGGVYTPVVV
ncbi:hypothetical protein, partial [Klebsiella oxytoca]|uniref:hypothetical protein n=1 Tax=Klebsiella oxytoca TaxID=571 RepID=UPI0025968BA3